MSRAPIYPETFRHLDSAQRFEKFEMDRVWLIGSGQSEWDSFRSVVAQVA